MGLKSGLVGKVLRAVGWAWVKVGEVGKKVTEAQEIETLRFPPW